MMILIILLISLTTSTNFIITLSSKDKIKNIEPIQPCSCQLAVFPVYDYYYHINVQIKGSYSSSHVQIYIPSQDICQNIKINDKNQYGVDIHQVDFGGETQVTEYIYVKMSVQGELCNSDASQSRTVYLIDKNQQSQYNYGIYLPHDAVIITQCIAFLALIALCSNIKYRRISPIKFGYLFAIFYPVFLFSIVYVSAYFQNTVDYTYYAAMLFSLVFICFYFADILSCCSDKPKIIYSIAIISGLILIILDMFIIVDAWFINDIIAILVAGTLIKFVVIKKMRASIIPLIIFWLFFVFRQFAIDFRIQNFEQAMEIRIIPLFLQIPTIFNDDNIGYPCSAFGTSKLVIMGLIVNYAIRIDLFLSGHFYTLIVSVSALISMLLQVVVAVVISQLPVVQYLGVIIFIPVGSALMLLAASKRGQWAQVWHGSFHDIAVDRKSVKKQSTEIDEQQINRNLQQLQMNPSLLSDN